MDPGTLPRASRNSRTSAIRIEVSCRQAHFSQSVSPNVPPAGGPEPRTWLAAGVGGGGVGGVGVEGVRLGNPHVGHRLTATAPVFPVTFARIVVSTGYVVEPKTAPAM